MGKMPMDKDQAGPSTSSSSSKNAKIPDLDSHLRTIILGLENASSGEKVPWTLPDKTQAALVAKAKEQLGEKPESGIIRPKHEMVSVKECWTPETSQPLVVTEGDNMNKRKSGLGFSALQRGIANRAPHSTISMLTWPQRHVPWWSAGSARKGGGDAESDGASIVSKDDKSEPDDVVKQPHRVRTGSCLPNKKTALVFLMGMITGGFLILLSLSFTEIEVDLDDCGGYGAPIAGGLVGRNNTGTSGRSPRNINPAAGGNNINNGKTTGKVDTGTTKANNDGRITQQALITTPATPVEGAYFTSTAATNLMTTSSESDMKISSHENTSVAPESSTVPAIGPASQHRENVSVSGTSQPISQMSETASSSHSHSTLIPNDAFEFPTSSVISESTPRVNTEFQDALTATTRMETVTSSSSSSTSEQISISSVVQDATSAQFQHTTLTTASTNLMATSSESDKKISSQENTSVAPESTTMLAIGSSSQQHYEIVSVSGVTVPSTSQPISEMSETGASTHFHSTLIPNADSEFPSESTPLVNTEFQDALTATSKMETVTSSSSSTSEQISISSVAQDSTSAGFQHTTLTTAASLLLSPSGNSISSLPATTLSGGTVDAVTTLDQSGSTVNAETEASPSTTTFPFSEISSSTQKGEQSITGRTVSFHADTDPSDLPRITTLSPASTTSNMPSPSPQLEVELTTPGSISSPQEDTIGIQTVMTSQGSTEASPIYQDSTSAVPSHPTIYSRIQENQQPRVDEASSLSPSHITPITTISRNDNQKDTKTTQEFWKDATTTSTGGQKNGELEELHTSSPSSSYQIVTSTPEAKSVEDDETIRPKLQQEQQQQEKVGSSVPRKRRKGSWWTRFVEAVKEYVVKVFK